MFFLNITFFSGHNKQFTNFFMIKTSNIYLEIKKNIAKITFVSILFISFPTYAQIEIRIKKILATSQQQFLNLEYVESIKTANTALKLSEKESYSKGITLSNIYIAKALSETGIYQSALKHLDNAEKEPFFEKYINAQIETYRLRGRIYGNLKMNDLAIREFYKQLRFSNQLNDSISRKKSIFWAHQNLSQIFSNTEQYDSLWNHLIAQKKIIENLQTLPLSDTYHDLSAIYISFGEEHTRKGNYVAARNNLDSAVAILKKNKSNYFHEVFNKYGDLEDAIGNTKKATDYYKLALNNAIDLKNKGAEQFGNKVLADYFLKNKLDAKETNEYLKRYQELNDSLKAVNNNVHEIILNQVLNQRNKEFKTQTKFYWIGFSALALLSVGLFLILWSLNRRKKANILSFKEELHKKEAFMEDFIKQHGQNKFEELIDLVKTNHPKFIILFKEIYPDFIAKLKVLDANIKDSEISFCALIYLNFTTKEIAKYTFVTIRAVQIRKNRLRKKYNIDSTDDLYIWIQNL